MSPPYVMLADVPEAERDLLLDNLTNGRAIAEGILANLARWVRLFERPKDAFPVSMEHEPVPPTG
jgi:hypothetical protein